MSEFGRIALLIDGDNARSVDLARIIKLLYLSAIFNLMAFTAPAISSGGMMAMR